jgi:hypothetical protein
MLLYQLALAGPALAPVCPPEAPLPIFAIFAPNLLSDLLGSPFFAANFLAFSFSFVGVAAGCDFFFFGVALGFDDAFFFGLDLGDGFGDGFGTALGDGVGCGVAAGISISLFAGAGPGRSSSGADGLRSGSGVAVSSIVGVSAVALASPTSVSQVISCALAIFEALAHRKSAIKATTWTRAINVTFRQKRALSRIPISIPLLLRYRLT